MCYAEKIKSCVNEEKENLIDFLRKLISINSETGREKEAVEFLVSEMKRYGFDEAYVDGIGNAVGRIGTGKTVFLYDAHVDTVSPGEARDWGFDPLAGKYEDGVIYGRGACDDKGPLASIIYAAKVLKKLSVREDFTMYVVGSITEEDCEGMATRRFIEERKIEPDYVVIAEASELRICRGHRGRAQYTITVPGKSGHASRPDAADNSLYKAAKIINGIEKMCGSLKDHKILGAGTIAATRVITKSNSINTIPGETVIYVDRRITLGETKEEIKSQIENVAGRYGAGVELMVYDQPSYTGFIGRSEDYFPAWLMEEDDPYVTKSAAAYREMFNAEPVVDVWAFSTNGVYTCGTAGFPTIGFGPGDGKNVHSERDQVSVEHLMKAAMFYAYLPLFINGGR